MASPTKCRRNCRQAIADAKAKKKGAKKILVLMNPPYAEAMNSGETSGNMQIESKVGVADNNAAYRMSELGYASRELFVQFILRISKELPNSTLAMFSTLKHVNAPNFELFRSQWRANYLGGFVFPSGLFEGLSGDFPVGFLVWKLRPEDVVATRFRTPLKREFWTITWNMLAKRFFMMFPLTSCLVNGSKDLARTELRQFR